MEISWIFVYSYVTLAFVALEITANEIPPKLLLISLDGLRYDFISPRRTPSLWLLSRRGVFFERGVKVQVHTVTASNHYSMTTGLFEESHGIIDNIFWDPALNEMYDVWNFGKNDTAYERSRLAHWYEGTTPIWQTNEEQKHSTRYSSRNRRRSGSLYWPMGNCFINNRTISRNFTWQDFGDELTWRKEIDTMIAWLTDENEPINFLLYYNAQPDHVAHNSSVYGSSTAKIVSGIDATIGYMIQRLRAVSLWDKINIILTADHGHTDVPDKQHLVELADYLNYSRVILNARSLFPKPGSGVTAEEIYSNLTRAQRERKLPMQIWRKEEFPIHYHYANHRRVGPVIVYEDLNYQLLFYGSIEEYTLSNSIPRSTHGWLNDYAEMRAFLIMYGPAFKSGLQVDGRDDIENIDLYPLMCKILDIEPLPNNGSFERIKFVLRDDDQATGATPNYTDPYLVRFSKSGERFGFAIAIAAAVCALLLGLLFVALYCCYRKTQGTNSIAPSPFGYRLLRHSSPESHVALTQRQSNAASNKNGSATSGKANVPGKKQNGDKARFQSNAITNADKRRRQLLRLSDEDLTSDENEL